MSNQRVMHLIPEYQKTVINNQFMCNPDFDVNQNNQGIGYQMTNTGVNTEYNLSQGLEVEKQACADEQNVNNKLYPLKTSNGIAAQKERYNEILLNNIYILKKYDYALQKIDNTKTVTKKRLFGIFGEETTEYDSNGNKVRITRTGWFQGTKEKIYNSDGKIIMKSRKINENLYMVFRPCEDGNVVSRNKVIYKDGYYFHYFRENITGKYYTKQYDKNGKNLYYIESYTSGDGVNSEHYLYDSKGTKIKYASEFPNGTKLEDLHFEHTIIYGVDNF